MNLSRLVLALIVVIGFIAPLEAESSLGFKEVRTSLDSLCSKCHGEKAQKDGVNLAPLKEESSVRKQRKLWQRILKQIESKEMPPEDQKQPTVAERAKIVLWITEAIRKAEQEDRDSPNPGKSVVRRLNRLEYNRTIRDLIGIDFDFSSAVGMPDDQVGDAFDNFAEALTLSTSLMEKYFASADLVLDKLEEEGKKKRPKGNPGPFEKIFFVQPDAKTPPRDAAKQIIEKLARRAYRRPLEPREIERFLKLFDASSTQKTTFVESLRPVLKALLVSPNFLIRVEEDRAGKESDKPERISDHELAVRLSYFLWSSMPDEELFRLAEKKELSQPKILETQVKRMLQDPKARSLTDSFAVQWLQLKRLENARPSTEFFPTFNNRMKQGMGEEITTFFDQLRKEDRSILELLDADYTYVNADLAKHYGFKPPTGNGFQKVTLEDPNRGGLLGMAGILALNSHTSRTSPTLRGKWILEVILGTPPPPPPPDAGMIDEKKQQGKSPKNFRELLAQHASQAVCANCHKKIDPLGFGLERFDAIGRFRDGKEIDATGKLPTGEMFDGPRELKQILLKRKGEFVKNLAQKLLSYSLGRPIQDYDEPAVKKIIEELEKNQFAFSRLILGIVESYPFQFRRNGNGEGE